MPLSHLLIDISLLGLFVCAALFALFRKWRTLITLVLRFVLGWGCLYLFEKYCGASGIHVAANFFTAGCVGVLGFPGFGLLLMLRYMYII